MKRLTWLIIALAVIGGGVYWVNLGTDEGGYVCNQDGKLCPDGSVLGRTGPKCEFPACPPINSSMTEAQAREIAEKSCIKGGESLAAGQYNAVTKTWWYDANLNATQPGCTPACVVSEETKTAEVNWRCTGLLQ